LTAGPEERARAATVDHGVVRTTNDRAVAAGHSVEVDPARWEAGLDELLGRVAGRFPRVEPRRHARALVLGLLADLPQKNCWTIAEHAGQATPDGMQHLSAGAVWDEHAVRDAVRDYLVEHLADPRRCWWSRRWGI
jgi:SRSO17 transposase